jgi:hypothetical protein
MYYNKKVKVKQFAEGDLVWNALLLIGTKYSAFGKWSPNWEGPFRGVRCVSGNAYILRGIYCCYKWKIFEEILS